MICTCMVQVLIQELEITEMMFCELALDTCMLQRHTQKEICNVYGKHDKYSYHYQSVNYG